jgi:hypothetical protein
LARGLYSSSIVTGVIGVVLAALGTAFCLETGMAQVLEATTSSKRALVQPLAPIEPGHLSSHSAGLAGSTPSNIRRASIPTGHRIGWVNTIGRIANPPALPLSNDNTRMISKLDRTVTDSKSRTGVKFIGGVGPPNRLSMSGAIEADADHILPRTGYIPTNEPTNLRAQGVTLGVELHY